MDYFCSALLCLWLCIIGSVLSLLQISLQSAPQGFSLNAPWWRILSSYSLLFWNDLRGTKMPGCECSPSLKSYSFSKHPCQVPWPPCRIRYTRSLSSAWNSLQGLMPMIDFCAHGTFPTRPRSPPGLWISYKLWAPGGVVKWPPCCFISHPETAFSSQLLDFLWSLKEFICNSLCELWLVRHREKGVMGAEVSISLRISSSHLSWSRFSNMCRKYQIQDFLSVSFLPCFFSIILHLAYLGYR